MSSGRAPRVGLRSGGRGGKRYTLAQKLAARTEKRPSGCWEVSGWALHSGHVHISEGRRRVRAHVLAWELHHGQRVPMGRVVMHQCDNPRCVNPDHLKVGTQRDNIIDSIHKGRYNTFGHQKLNAQQVHEIRARAAAGELHRTIAHAYGIARNTVSGIVRRKSWDHLTNHPALDAVFVRVPSQQLEIRGEVR